MRQILINFRESLHPMLGSTNEPQDSWVILRYSDHVHYWHDDHFISICFCGVEGQVSNFKFSRMHFTRIVYLFRPLENRLV